MRVLLDESLPRQLSRHLADHDVATVASRGWSSVGNGELLRLAAGEGFEVFLTVDQGIEFQQSLRTAVLGVVIVRARSNRMEHLLPLVPEIRTAIERTAKGQLLCVGG